VTDQTPEARLAAALLAALKDTGYLLTHEYADSGVIDVGDAMVRADPTLAADLALAAAVRRLDTGQTNVTLTRWPNGKWTAITATVGSATGWGGPSDSLLAALEALRDD